VDRSLGKAARELGIGIGTSVGVILAVFWASPFVLEFFFVVMTLGVLVWAATTDVGGLTGRSRVVLFAGLILALGVSIGLFTATLRLMMLLITALLLTTTVVWVGRIVRRLP
jgi:hypothetical protein